MLHRLLLLLTWYSSPEFPNPFPCLLQLYPILLPSHTQSHMQSHVEMHQKCSRSLRETLLTWELLRTVAGLHCRLRSYCTCGQYYRFSSTTVAASHASPTSASLCSQGCPLQNLVTLLKPRQAPISPCSPSHLLTSQYQEGCANEAGMMYR